MIYSGKNVTSLDLLPLLERRLDVGMRQLVFLPLIIFVIAIFVAAIQRVVS